MDKVILGTILIFIHIILATYGSLVVKDIIRLSPNTKTAFYVFNFLVPLIGFLISMFLNTNQKKNRSSRDNNFTSTVVSGYICSNDSAGQSGGGDG